QRLAGNRVDQIKVNPRKARAPRDLDAARQVLRIVMPLEHFQLAGIETLSAETDPIDALLAEHLAILEIRGGRIDLNGPLLHVRKLESIAQSDDQPAHLLQRQQRRRPAAKENRAWSTST